MKPHPKVIQGWVHMTEGFLSDKNQSPVRKLVEDVLDRETGEIHSVFYCNVSGRARAYYNNGKRVFYEVNEVARRVMVERAEIQDKTYFLSVYGKTPADHLPEEMRGPIWVRLTMDEEAWEEPT